MRGKSIEQTAVAAASGFGSAISLSKRRLTFTCCDWNNNRFSVHTYYVPRAPNLAPLASGLPSAHTGYRVSGSYLDFTSWCGACSMQQKNRILTRHMAAGL